MDESDLNQRMEELNQKISDVESPISVYNAQQKPLAPVDFPVGTFNQNPGQVFQPNAQPITPPESAGHPGFFETVGSAWKRTNDVYQVGKFAIHEGMELNPLEDEVPEDWSVWNESTFQGFDKQYFPYLSESKSPKDLEARQARVREQMYDDARFDEGSMMAKLIGGGAGIATSLSTYAIPMAAGVKYARFTENLMRNTIKAVPAIGAQSAILEGATEANRAGGNLQEAAVNTLRDTIFGTALLGGGNAIGHALTASQNWNLRNMVNLSFKGVKAEPIIEDGVIKSWKAVPGKNMAANAAEVQYGQLFLDSALHMGGLFKLPFVGEKLANLAGNSVFGSPVIKGLTSPYSVVREFTNRMSSGAPITKGEEAGVVRPDSVEDIYDGYRRQATAYTQYYRDMQFSANGLEGGQTIANTWKNLKQTISENKNITDEQFGVETRSVVNTQKPSTYSQINDVAKTTSKLLEEVGTQYNLSRGFDRNFENPLNQASYLMQNWHIPKIVTDEDSWIQITADGLKKQDQIIEDLLAPVQREQAIVDSIKAAQMHPEFKETRAMVNELSAARGRLKAEHANLRNLLKDDLARNIDGIDFHYRALLEDRIFLNNEEASELGNILKPMQDFEEVWAASKADLAKLRQGLSKVKSNLQKSVKDSTRENALKKIKSFEERIAKQEEVVHEHNLKFESERFRLEEKAHAGELNSKFFTKFENQISFRNPNELPKIRKSYESDAARYEHARAQVETIMGNNPSQLTQMVLGDMYPGSQAANSTKRRSILLPQELYNRAGFIDPDLSKGMTNYLHTMGRHIAFNKVFRNPSTEGIDDLLRGLKQEHDGLKVRVFENKPSPERDKAARKLEKQFEENKKFMSAMYKVYMGTYGGKLDPKLQAFLGTLRNYLAATKLGAVPVLQLADLGAIVLKAGLMPFMSQGLRPMLTSIFGNVKSRESEAMKANASHALLGLEHVRNGYMEKYFNGGSMSHPPVGGLQTTALNASEWLAHSSNNFFGTNYIENMNQRIMANTFQSEVMRAMFDFKAGKLSKAQSSKMARYGIDVKKDADTFIAEYEKAGGWNEFGGYQSQYYNWQDAAATNRMAMSIRRAVRDAVVQRNMFTSPFWSNNPILGMIFMFHGWAYSAFNRYTMPIMQRPDAEHLLGVVTMVGLGMMTEPIRRYLNGKEMFKDDEEWYQTVIKGLDNSGFLGPIPEAMESFNLATGNAIIPGLQSERYANRGRFSALGPAGGLIDDGFNLLHHGYKGDITQHDAKQAAHLLPYAGFLPFRRSINKFIESTDLPEKRSDAEPWAWRQSVYGEGK